MVKIRLMRIGAKKRPFYRVVAIDERRQRGGKYLELLGTYNPLTKPHEIILKSDRIDWWIKNGAILSDGYLRITKQAPQKPPRKPKKERKQDTGSGQIRAEEAKVKEKGEEAQVDEATDGDAKTENARGDAEEPASWRVTRTTNDSEAEDGRRDTTAAGPRAEEQAEEVIDQSDKPNEPTTEKS